MSVHKKQPILRLAFSLLLLGLLLTSCGKSGSDADRIFSKSVGDFSDYVVENLDSSPDVNFLVYNKAAHVLPAGQDTLVSADYEARVYVFTSPSAELLALQPGDVFVVPRSAACPDGLTAKVGEIRAEGGTVTVVGDAFVLGDVYEYIEIDMDVDVNGLEYDPDTLLDSESSTVPTAQTGSATVTPLAARKGKLPTALPLATATGGGLSFSSGFRVTTGPVDLTLNGSLHIEAPHVTFFYSLPDLYLDLSVTMGARLESDVSLAVGGFHKFNYPFMTVNIPLGTTPLKLSVQPGFTGEVSGSIRGSAHLSSSQTLGFAAGMDKSAPAFQPVFVSSGPNVSNFDLDLEGKLEVLLGLRVGVGVIGLGDLYGQLGDGLEFTGAASIISLSDGAADTVHDCEQCIDGDINGVGRVSVGVDLSWIFDNLVKTDTELDLLRVADKWNDFYVSHRVGADGGNAIEMGFGECPHLRYRTLIHVQDEDGKAMGGVRVALRYPDGRTDECTANGDGEATTYLPSGDTTMSAAASGQSGLGHAVVDHEPTEATLKLSKDDRKLYIWVEYLYWSDPDVLATDCYSTLLTMLKTCYPFAVIVEKEVDLKIHDYRAELDMQPGDLLWYISASEDIVEVENHYYSDVHTFSHEIDRKATGIDYMFTFLQICLLSEDDPQNDPGLYNAYSLKADGYSVSSNAGIENPFANDYYTYVRGLPAFNCEQRVWADFDYSDKYQFIPPKEEHPPVIISTQWSDPMPYLIPDNVDPQTTTDLTLRYLNDYVFPRVDLLWENAWDQIEERDLIEPYLNGELEAAQ